ncbi:MAG: (2Fe-2S)-binding protein [Gammaproteobacteria bacterium]|nr:MAG: (2Fe-2S)-binding protein [Gammaproteobacteria bacterium]
MYVCICKAVTDNDIKQAVADGACSFRDVRNQLGAATQCGKCATTTRDIIKQELSPSGEQAAPLFYAVG